MAKKRYTTEYVNKEIMRVIEKYPQVAYYIFFGERKDGKTYGGKEYALNKTVFQDHKKFIYLRRLHSHIVKSKMRKEFDDMKNVIKDIYGVEKHICYDTQKGFYYEDKEEEIIGYAMAIEDCMNVKSIPFTEIGCIIFDEFIDYHYMDNEIQYFLNIIDTICRDYPDIKIFMFGNTINKFSPYYELFGFDPRKLKQGEAYYLQHSLGVKAVVMHTPTRVKDIRTKEKTSRYIGFDNNESVNMIMFGEWDYDHCNTQIIDGVTWNSMKHLVPMYITGIKQTFELSIHTESPLPILFIRDINTQNGKVRKEIKYNLAYDNTVLLTKQITDSNSKKKNVYVPTINCVNGLVDKLTLDLYKKCLLCIDSGRVIFNSIATGSDFLNMITEIRKRGA